ncbi:hypothetical protein LY28_02733 [Ruminiclostridium sufflavum DSM 19573]|uniref:Uncharacterized protein n=1 Tax=Ruminiclostridium sufflavum DSM 19573 TaxID=1121337 RepID=A0A318XV32_9FIRM|nr:hypothetical protein [Ruminiclostridium sufflavum]PYG86707.1 hypothetical protein LY28_02733 [Ruminiclostridium sufflavum DSM 19573]
MTKHEKYIQELSKTNFVTGLTSSIFANEIGARALLKILMDKGIITLEEWNNAIHFVTERFVDLHVHDYDELSEPDFLDFNPRSK